MLSVINKTQERRHSVFLLLTLNKFYIRVTEKLKKIIKQYRKSLIETRKVKRTCQSSVAFKVSAFGGRNNSFTRFKLLYYYHKSLTSTLLR